MPWTLTVIALVLLLALPLAGRSRGLHASLALAAIAWLLVLALFVLGADALLAVFAHFNEPTLHDTYYVVAHVHFQLLQVVLTAFLAFGAWFARPLPRLATACFWLGHIAMVGANIGPNLVPLTTEQIGLANTITQALALIAILFFLILAALITVGLSARARRPR